jgi:2,3-bisphosphoglycerate-dependent phosphoglycerate mutase
MILYLIRHGESLGNVDPDTYRRIIDCDVPLTKLGIKQAKECGKILSKDHIDEDFRQIDIYGYSDPVLDIEYSPYLRAKDTCKLISNKLPFDHKCKENVLLREREWGELREHVESEYFDPNKHLNFFYRPDNGESFADLYTRVVTYFNSIINRGSHRIKVIVAHGEWIKLALMYLDGVSVEDFTKNYYKIGNCEINKRTIT